MERKMKMGLAAAVALSLSVAAQAQVHYSTSFEPPTYTAGSSVNGVDGWVNGSGSGASQSVSSALASHGSQSLLFDNSSTLSSFYSVRRPVGTPWTNATDVRQFSVDLWIDQSTQANRLYGLYIASTATGTMGGNVLGLTVGGDGSIRAGNTWGMTYQNTGLIGTVGAANVLGRWLTITLSFDPVSLTSTASVSGLGGGNPTVSTSWTSGTAPALLSLNLGTDYFATTDRAGQGYFDNLQIIQVPAPGALALLGLAGFISSRRRRRH